MHRQLKIMIIADALLGLVYVASSLFMWNTINLWLLSDVATQWSIILVKPVLIGMVHSLPTSFQPILNIPFLLFWVAMAVNLYFITSLQRSKETS